MWKGRYPYDEPRWLSLMTGPASGSPRVVAARARWHATATVGTRPPAPAIHPAHPASLSDSRW
eukprot:CAMPEP_0179336432 /NCGR_PEP_ID=MMETSP0797-20121207/67040_1 /TAXON_ID=47934 /ORGANISM="Dinophysis acuminata, Strain DAEP01" /LENGTH=62 /DNA_ID=CAMNT_0021049919 /DNA_START=26 /DNA_END=211 /DNA_ORIENTATION=+